MSTDRLESLKKDLSAKLLGPARAYLETGLRAFYETSKPSDAAAQCAVGNLTAGAELSLKGLIASRNPGLLFKDLPLEARIFFQAAGHVPEGFNWKPYDLDLRDFAFDTVGLDDAIKIFYVFFPETKRRLRPYFRLLSELAPLCLKSSIGPARDGETEKAAYVALQVSAVVAAQHKTGFNAYTLSDKDLKFIKDFTAAQNKKVEDRLAAAREKAASLKVDISFNEPLPHEGWETLETRCPVCKNWAGLSGWTDIFCEAGGHEALTFFADAFDCGACGLLLEDAQELKSAGLPVTYDRSEDLVKWDKDESA